MSRSKQSRPSRSAFTLVELLVVIGIIAVLISMLLPALGKARDAARTVACASVMREIGSGILGFASEHDGRLPGSASGAASVAWHDIMNDEYFKSKIKIARMTPATLMCPMWEPSYGNTRRGFTLPMNAAGGDNSGANPYSGPYGLEITPASAIKVTYTRYRLGARLTRYRTHSEKFLVLESEAPRDTIGVKWPGTSDLIWYPGDSASRAAWSGNDGNYAFRHSNYKLANFLFMDGHVETLGPRDHINFNSRFTVD